MGEDKALQFERFCLILSQIPRGKVCSYGHLATLVGLSSPRQSAALLRKLPQNTQLPWYRVVGAQGRLSAYAGNHKQRCLLEADGIIFTEKGTFSKQYYI